MLLNILNNDNLLLAAETLIIVVGSMLLGILLCYLNSGGTRQKLADLLQERETSASHMEALRGQVQELSGERLSLVEVTDQLKSKISEQARAIFDLQNQVFQKDGLLSGKASELDTLKSTLQSYQGRLDTLQQEIEKQSSERNWERQASQPVLRANYEHVSKLLGRQVTENDLTIITGIGPKTAGVLQARGISTWDQLANTSLELLQSILAEAGGVYKNQDPTYWARQAAMAAAGEWRKLRVFQEALRQKE